MPIYASDTLLPMRSTGDYKFMSLKMLWPLILIKIGRNTFEKVYGSTIIKSDDVGVVLDKNWKL